MRQALTIVGQPLRDWILERTREQIAALELFIRSGEQPANAQTRSAWATTQALGDELVDASMTVEIEKAVSFVHDAASSGDRAPAIGAPGRQTMALFVDASCRRHWSKKGATVSIGVLRLALSEADEDWLDAASELLVKMCQPDPSRALEPVARRATARSNNSPVQVFDPAPFNRALLAPEPWMRREMHDWHAHASWRDLEPVKDHVRASGGGWLAEGVARILGWTATSRLRASDTEPDLPDEVIGGRRRTEQADEPTVAIEVSSLLGGFRGCAHEKPIGNLPVSCVTVNASALMARMLVRHVAEELSPIGSSILERLMPASELRGGDHAGANFGLVNFAPANLSSYGIARRRISSVAETFKAKPCSEEHGERYVSHGFGSCPERVPTDEPKSGLLALLTSLRA